tara:strand:+ start:366 stop:539 length:174 start_codon:yes stop_codon:yes gene_type:complete
MLYYIPECSTQHLEELMHHPASTLAVQDEIQAELNKRRQEIIDQQLSFEGKTFIHIR